MLQRIERIDNQSSSISFCKRVSLSHITKMAHNKLENTCCKIQCTCVSQLGHDLLLNFNAHTYHNKNSNIIINLFHTYHSCERYILILIIDIIHT